MRFKGFIFSAVTCQTFLLLGHNNGAQVGLPSSTLHFHRNWGHQLRPVGSKSHKHIHFWSSLSRDFSATVPPIPKMFALLKTVIQGLHFLFNNLLDTFSPWPRKRGAQLDLPSVRSWLVAVFSLGIYFYEQRKRLVSYCCCGKFANASRYTVMHERFRDNW